MKPHGKKPRASTLIEAAHEAGVEIGKSIAAMTNFATEHHRRDGRAMVVERLPRVEELGPGWWAVCARAFDDGYARGKQDPEGARERVRLARALRRAVNRTGGGAE